MITRITLYVDVCIIHVYTATYNTNIFVMSYRCKPPVYV